MKTYVHLYLAQFFLKREVPQKKVVEKIKTQIFIFSNLFLKIVQFMQQRKKICALHAG
jgi:hypothetical protein